MNAETTLIAARFQAFIAVSANVFQAVATAPRADVSTQIANYTRNIALAGANVARAINTASGQADARHQLSQAGAAFLSVVQAMDGLAGSTTVGTSQLVRVSSEAQAAALSLAQMDPLQPYPAAIVAQRLLSISSGVKL